MEVGCNVMSLRISTMNGGISEIQSGTLCCYVMQPRICNCLMIWFTCPFPEYCGIRITPVYCMS